MRKEIYPRSKKGKILEEAGVDNLKFETGDLVKHRVTGIEGEIWDYQNGYYLVKWIDDCYVHLEPPHVLLYGNMDKGESS